jgi:predicted DNA-binding transcriptional regulator AlpA
MTPHRPLRQPARGVVRKPLADETADEAPNDWVSELRLNLAGAAVDGEERLGDDPHEHRVLAASSATGAIGFGYEGGEVVDRGVGQNRFDPLQHRHPSSDAQAVAQILGLAQRTSVSVYQRRYPDMPRPVVDLGRGRRKLWLRSEVIAWGDRTGRL